MSSPAPTAIAFVEDEEGDVVFVAAAPVPAGYPAPTRLATPTDLSSAEVAAVVVAVNPLVADALVLYIKTKNFHWHASGPHFRDYHLLFDEQANQILDSVDVLAERVRKLGGTTVRSIGHIGGLTGIADDNQELVSAGEMISRLLDDNRLIATRQRAAIAACEANGDSVTANILQELLDGTERRIWFLFETGKGAR